MRTRGQQLVAASCPRRACKGFRFYAQGFVLTPVRSVVAARLDRAPLTSRCAKAGCELGLQVDRVYDELVAEVRAEIGGAATPPAAVTHERETAS